MTDTGTELTPPFASGRTRYVYLDAGQRRDEGDNMGTHCGMPLGFALGDVPFEALFFAHYSAIRSFCRSAREPGVGVVAVHIPTCRLSGRLWLRARIGRPAAAVLGRHSRADLPLDDDAGLSLRHLALVLHPLRSWDGHDARFSVLDLRTGRAFRDEKGRQLEGVRCQGPALLTCGDYALYLLQTGDATDWPPLAADAWGMLPRRVYLDERSAEPDRWQRRVRPRARMSPDSGDGAQTLVTAIRGPVSADDELIGEGETPLGALSIITRRSALRLVVGRAAASRGILLGRYSRCDASDLLTDLQFSRTHLLLLRVEGSLYAFDTASTGGSRVERGGEEAGFRVLTLEGETHVALGDGGAGVRWHPA